MNNKVKSEIFSKKGFFIGDLCYVLSDEIYHEFWGRIFAYKDGVYETENNLKFAVSGTAWYFQN